MKLNENQKTWLQVLSLVAIGIGYLRLIQPPTRKKYSNFNPLTSEIMENLGVENMGSRDRVIFTLTNSTPKPQKVDLFDSFSQQTFAQQNPNVSVQSVPNVDFFAQSIINEPIALAGLEVRSPNTKQINQMIRIQAKDASGNEAVKYVYPLVSAYQSQGDIATASLEGLVLSGRTKIDDYVILPNTTVSITMYFAGQLKDQAKRNPRAAA